MIGKRVAHFEILKELGRGGMGRVYLAKDTRLKRNVALKFPDPNFIRDTKVRDRFLMEARLAAGLDHPFICSIFEVGEGNTLEDTYIAMEHLAGETLQTRLHRGPLPPREAIRFGREIAEALSVAHQAGLIHRDLKPSNIMIMSSGHIKILDFGLARNVVSSENATTVTLFTKTGATPGTIPYMSPEQLRNENLTTVSDLFPLGVTLYEMLTGEHPFPGTTAAEVAGAVLHQEPQPLSSVLENCPPTLERTVEHLLVKDPALRTQSAVEAVSALRLLTDDPSTLANVRNLGTAPRKVRRPRSGGPWWKNRTLRLALLAALVAALYLGRDQWIPALPGGDTFVFTNSATPHELNQEAASLLERWDRVGNLEKAVALLEQSLKQDPENAPAQAGLAAAYWYTYWSDKEPETLTRAHEHATRGVTLNRHLSSVRYRAAMIAADRGNFPEAREHVDQGFITDPGNARLHMAEGYVFYRQGRPDSADARYREALNLDPENWEAYLHYGTLLVDLGNYAGAESTFQSGVDRSPENHHLYFNLAAAQHYQGKENEAAANYQHSLEIRPSWEAYSNLGTLLFFQGHFDHAVSAYESALSVDDNDYLGWANLADACRWIPGREQQSTDAYGEAVVRMNDLLKQSPEDITLLTRKAEYLAKMGQRDDAVETLNQISQLGELDLYALNCVVLANELIGRRSQALEHLEQMLEGGYPISFVEQDPELKELRQETAYRTLADRFSSEN